MNCSSCKGDLEKRMIRYVQDFQGRVVIIENVPAEVCTQCGEQLIAPDTAKKVQQIVWGEVPRAGTIEVDSYDFANVA